jgi:hypothetical protein
MYMRIRCIDFVCVVFVRQCRICLFSIEFLRYLFRSDSLVLSVFHFLDVHCLGKYLNNMILFCSYSNNGQSEQLILYSDCRTKLILERYFPVTLRNLEK